MKRFLALATSTAIGAVLNCSLLPTPGANAATFNFTFNDVLYGDVGSGSLSFTDAESSLSTTNGTGIFQFSDLGSSAAFNFSVLSSAFGITHTAPVSGIGPFFQFEGGNLVGLTFSDTEPEPFLGIESLLFVQGDLFLIGPGIGGVPILGASFGLIDFNTIQAWTPTVPPTGTSTGTDSTGSSSSSSAAVPEPSTVLGLTIAAALGACGKRRCSSRSKLAKG